jgi:hypothetical protein
MPGENSTASPSDGAPLPGPATDPASVDLTQDIIAAMQSQSYHDVVKKLDAMLGMDGFSQTMKAARAATPDQYRETRELFKEDVEQLRRRMKVARRGLINPRSQYMAWWDVTTAVALLYTCFVTPFGRLHYTSNTAFAFGLVFSSQPMTDSHLLECYVHRLWNGRGRHGIANRVGCAFCDQPGCQHRVRN